MTPSPPNAAAPITRESISLAWFGDCSEACFATSPRFFGRDGKLTTIVLARPDGPGSPAVLREWTVTLPAYRALRALHQSSSLSEHDILVTTTARGIQFTPTKGHSLRERCENGDPEGLLKRVKALVSELTRAETPATPAVPLRPDRPARAPRAAVARAG